MLTRTFGPGGLLLVPIGWSSDRVRRGDRCSAPMAASGQLANRPRPSGHRSGCRCAR